MSGIGRVLFTIEREKFVKPAMVVGLYAGTGIVSGNTTNISLMFRHTFLLIFRNFRKYRTTFGINLIGLSSGLACAMLISLWVMDEYRMDKLSENDARTMRILGHHQQEGGIKTALQTPGLLHEAIKAEFPEVEYATGIRTPGTLPKFTIGAGNEHYKARLTFASPDFFKIFPWPLTDGDRDKALASKNSILLSESMAMKLFHTTEGLIGKAVKWQQEQTFTVTGIFKDIPATVSDPFDYILPYAAYTSIPGVNIHWDNHNIQTIVLLKPGVDLAAFNTKIADFVKIKEKESQVTLEAQQYSENYLYGKFTNGVRDGGRIEYVRLLSLIAIFILLIASINFMNLSTARASRRMKEVGVKKAIGAGQGSLILQYLGESVLLSFLSLIVALIAVFFLMPFFNGLTGKQLALFGDFRVLGFFLLLTIVTGVLAGSYPALYLSGFKPVTILKGQFTASLRELWVRKGLVVFQFSISIVLILAVIVVYLQLRFVQHKNMGYDKDNVVYFFKEGRLKEDSRQFLQRLREMPGVISAGNTTGNLVSHWGTTVGVGWQGKSPDLNIEFGCQAIDVGLIETVGMKMAQGRSYSADFPTDSNSVIINEAAVKAMGISDPVGRELNFWGSQRKIIGVVKDFNFRTVHKAVTPWIFYFDPVHTGAIAVRLAAGDPKATVDKIEKLSAEMNPGIVLEIKWLDDDLQQQYLAETRVGVLSRYFAGLAVIISCLGLFGLAAFTAERRMKEISVRKVLGGSAAHIVLLLSADFTRLVLVAVAIALPAGWWIARKWLDTFAYRIELQWWYFALAGILALVTAWLTVGSQAVKAAHVDPVRHLKD